MHLVLVKNLLTTQLTINSHNKEIVLVETSLLRELNVVKKTFLPATLWGQ